MTDSITIPEEIQFPLTALVTHIQNTEPFRQYSHARELFNADADAQSLMKQLSDVQNDIRQKQFDNQVSADDLNHLRQMQSKVQENMVIIKYAQAQQEAVGALREINAQISEMIGTDFAALARNTSC